MLFFERNISSVCHLNMFYSKKEKNIILVYPILTSFSQRLDAKRYVNGGLPNVKSGQFDAGMFLEGELKPSAHYESRCLFLN